MATRTPVTYNTATGNYQRVQPGDTIDPAYLPTSPVESIFVVGDGANTLFTIVHNLNNSRVGVRVIRTADGAEVHCGGPRRTSANDVVVNLGTTAAPIATNSHQVIVSGVAGIG